MQKETTVLKTNGEYYHYANEYFTHIDLIFYD